MQGEEEVEEEKEKEEGVDTAEYKSRDRGEKRTSECCRVARVTSIW